jgi:dedicated sortase system histidine kinase
VTLRRQLLLVSLLLLSLPWAGCQFIREMEGALRQGQEQALLATATAVAATLGTRPGLIYPHKDRLDGLDDSGLELYASPLDQPLILDGYGDGWEDISGGSFHSDPDAAPLSVDYRAVTRGDYLYLLLKIDDPIVIYHNPGLSPEPNGDRLVLRTWQDNSRQDYVIATAAPGKVRARAASRRQRGADAGRIRGYWQDAVGGYTLELEIPLSYTGGRLGFYLLNTSGKAGRAVETLGNVNALETSAPPWLIYSPGALRQTLAPLRQTSGQVQVVDNSQWLLADIPAGGAGQSTAQETFWLLRVIYRSILSRDPLPALPNPPALGKLQGGELASALAGKAETLRYRDPNYATRTSLATAVPIRHEGAVIGAVRILQSGEEYLSLTDQAFSKLLGYSLLALGMGVLGMLGYATLLSWRIGKLSRAASQAVREVGVVLDDFPRSRAADEIGELSRRYADLLDRLREYNDYLRSLSRKLAHELRTPVAVIQTSLENLEQSGDPQHRAGVYIDRAKDGLQRLNRILTAMSEANRLEESIRNNHAAPLDLVPLLQEVFLAYQAMYRDHRLELNMVAPSAMVSGVGDLIVQALDKLLDNAVSFCPAGGRIELQLRTAADGWEISVANEGPTLPPEMQNRLFEPMVSVREQVSEQVHLGLGLHVVRLISEFHGATLTAGNLPADNGVRIAMTLPAAHTQD